MSRKDLQEEELEKVNGGTYKSLNEISRDAKCMSWEEANNRICSNFNNDPSLSVGISCCQYCAHAINSDTGVFLPGPNDWLICCEDYASDFRAIDPNMDYLPRNY